MRTGTRRTVSIPALPDCRHCPCRRPLVALAVATYGLRRAGRLLEPPEPLAVSNLGSTPLMIPLVDLQAAHAEVAEEVDAGFKRVLANTAFVGGEEVAAFEREFAEFSAVAH